MKATSGILLAVVIGLAWMLHSEIATTRQLNDQLAEFKSVLGDKTTPESQLLQEKCTIQTEKLFGQMGYKPNSFPSYHGNFSARFNRCFMAVETMDENGQVGKFLLDTYHNRKYAEYQWTPEKNKNNWEVLPTICRLSPSVKDERTCKSAEEYQAFVAHYLD